MPNHLHLLLIVDFDRCPKFNPLVFIHWFMFQSERWIDAILGGTTPAPPLGAKDVIEPPEFVYFPCDFNYPRGPNGEEGALAIPFAQGGAGAKSPMFAWEDGFWLDLPMSPAQLRAIRRYIRLNPARAIWKQRHPDRFKVIKVATDRLFASRQSPAPAALPVNLTALGNIALLGSPFLLHVRLTVRKTVAEHAETIADIVEKAKRGYVPVSGFISPGEKELLSRLKDEPRARFIKLVPYALPTKYDPSAEDSRELATDRLAIVSLQPETAAIRSLDIRQSQSAAHQFRQNCLAMNDLAAALCAAVQ